MDDIRNLSHRQLGYKKFDLILMDPPWENKHVKRALKRRKNEEKVQTSDTQQRIRNDGYEMLDNHTIGRSIPMNNILSENGLAVIYCTNSKRHQTAIQEWLKNWNLAQITKWYWLKASFKVIFYE